MTRYHRQELIENWNQEKITQSRILINGEGLLGNLTLIGAAAMGFGDIEYYSTGKDVLSSDQNKGVVELAQRINPEVSLLGLKMNLSRNMGLLGKYDAIIEASNDPCAKYNLWEYCLEKKIPFLSASASEEMGGLGVMIPDRVPQNLDMLLKNLLFLENASYASGVDTSGVMAGLAVEELRKIIAPIGPEKNIDDIVLYYPRESPYFSRHELAETGQTERKLTEHKLTDRERTEQISTEQRKLARRTAIDLAERKVAIIGAGALGNTCGLDLVLSGIGQLDIYDFDEIESTNLNRQFLFYDKVGQPKATVLAERLSALNKKVKVVPHTDKITLADAKKLNKKYDVLIDCVDSFKTRALLNYISRSNAIPLISGGSSYRAGQVITCQDTCLDCQFDINQKAKAAAQAQSCIYAPTPSVITSNMIIGFMQGAQSKNLQLDKQETKKTESLKDAKERTNFPILKYTADEEFRLGEIASPSNCRCTPEGLYKVISQLYTKE